MTFLYEIFNNPFAIKELNRLELPLSIEQNLKHSIRPYQEEAFKRFIYYLNEDLEGKQPNNFHLMFNMATGSGKTMLMAGLMLYLYEKGYRNFLFFVDSNNIIQKTKENFLNAFSGKYLFQDKIIISNQEVLVKEVENFNDTDENNINVKFTTIQQLHIDLNSHKENALTYEDFADKKLVLLADEAHHLSGATIGKGDLFSNWEDTVERIHKSNVNNLLLEFTATIDYSNSEISKKYENKVLYKYDLKEFRNDKYSKEINLFRSYFDEENRILQALLLNLYRQELANEHHINLKPVILFKAKKTVKESEENKLRFHQLIENLSVEQIENLRQKAEAPIIKKAFRFLENKGFDTYKMVERTKLNFKEENCLSANNESEKEQNQLLLNSLEDESNPIRAIFAVQKLNEGWDVLNLYDIVRLYEGRDSKGNTPGKTTISEAQLIGRGARYFPFQLNAEQEKYKRKYDYYPENDLRVLEELYYHTKEDSRYISELKQALINTGMYDDEKNIEVKELKLKEVFKKDKFYTYGKVFFNKKIEKSYNFVKSLADFGVSKRNFEYQLSSGLGTTIQIFEEKKIEELGVEKIKQKEVSFSEIPQNVILFALAKNSFFNFSHLTKYFPNIKSIFDFIKKVEYLGGLKITFKGTSTQLENISNKVYLDVVSEVLKEIELECKGEIVAYEGSEVFQSDYIYNVFKDKKLRIRKDDERAQGDETFLFDKMWYVYNANYGTSEEKHFVQLFDRRYNNLKEKYEDIFLFRNELDVKIYDKKGRAFQPDFILFCKKKHEKAQSYQIFIEPKGEHLRDHDQWKENFLKQLNAQQKILSIEMDKYKIVGLPFYTHSNENEFLKIFDEVLG